MTSLHLQNLEQTLISKSWPNFNIEIYTKLQQLVWFGKRTLLIKTTLLSFLVRVTSAMSQMFPRAQWTRGWILPKEITSCHKFLHKSLPNFIFRISTKVQLQNLSQTSAFWLNLNFKILTKPSLWILTKIKLDKLNQATAANYWPNFSFKISPKF